MPNIYELIELLLSGEVKQTRNRLYAPETGCYCVEGAIALNVGYLPHEGEGGYMEHPISENRLYAYITSDVAQDYGFDTYTDFTDAIFPEVLASNNFAYLNDGSEMTFQDFADYLGRYAYSQDGGL